MRLFCESLERQGLRVEGGVVPQGTIAKRVMRAGCPDILHLHWLNPFFLRGDGGLLEAPLVTARMGVSLSLLRTLRAVGTRIVWTAHNLGSHDGKMQWADRFFHGRIGRMCDAIVAHSPHAGDEVVRALELEASEKVEVIPHGNYLDIYPNDISRPRARRRLDLSGDRPVLLFVGLIRPYKNLEYLLEIFASEFDEGEARLLVAGQAMDDALQRRIRRLGEEDPNVALHLEYIPDDDLQVFHNAADAVVLPYRDILTSGSAVMGMSFGRPIVAPKIGTLRDVVGDEGGFLYDPDDSRGLAGALREAVATDREELARIGERNLARARSWSWESVARQTHQLYRRIVV